jgi:hypothetical protein
MFPSSKTEKSEESNDLYLNFGFSPNFFSEIKEEIYIIEKNPMRKIFSANAVLNIPIEEQIEKKKIYDAEDKELYNQQEEDYCFDLNKNDNLSLNFGEKITLNDNNNQYYSNSIFFPFNTENNIFSNFSQNQIMNLNKIIEEMNKSYENRKVIKAYKSKLKSKFYKIYEFNSKDYLEKVKYKLFHKCCFPNCGRTFSSSGWLKAHFEEHIKDLKKNKFNILFEKFIRNNKNLDKNFFNNYNTDYLHI